MEMSLSRADCILDGIWNMTFGVQILGSTISLYFYL